MRFTVLASGSAGNASLLEVGGCGVLIDAGLGPRQLTERFRVAGLTWSRVQAAILTHTHSDHWNDRTLAYFLKHRIPFYCHPDHQEVLGLYAPSFPALKVAGLVRPYQGDVDLRLFPAMLCRPLPISHDGIAFGFRFDLASDLFGNALRLGYLADLGTWDDALTEALTDSDALAVEFNHDVGLEYASGRSPRLIQRVLGDQGHLSNAQAAAFVRAVMQRSTPGRLRWLVQLHLSRDCNRPHLAAQAAQKVLSTASYPIELHTASQDVPTSTLILSHELTKHRAKRAPRRVSRKRVAAGQPCLPGFEPD